MEAESGDPAQLVGIAARYKTRGARGESAL